MTTKEYWLTKLGEELNEAQKDVFKALTFGLDDIDPEKKLTNKVRICNELVDIEAVLKILWDDFHVDLTMRAGDSLDKSIERKRKYYEVSKSQGIIED